MCRIPKKRTLVHGNPNWRRVVDKCDKSWTPRKDSVICSRHFNKADINGRKLRPGAIPFKKQFVQAQIEALAHTRNKNSSKESNYLDFENSILLEHS